MPHLWEIEHPYYCNEGNYYAPGRDQPFQAHESWKAFMEDEGDSDLDMNLVFRWDWRKADPAGDKWENDTDVLLIFFMGQRKGLYRWVQIEVTNADEEAVKTWLSVRWNHLKTLWEGIAS